VAGDPEPGDRIDAYEVIGPIARGGMATVLAVRDTRTGDEVAMKLLLPLELEEEARSRFRREFRALSRMSHPNVLKVYEWGLLGDRPWFTMERLPGTDLREAVGSWRELVAEERFSLAQRTIQQVAQALAYIHDRGLIHRDVTPGNIRVGPDGGVKLMDFGVVKELEGADHTTVGEVVGTVAYMAPEQIGGENIDARADLYSLGAVLYLLLTGQRPFKAHTIHGFMEQHLNAKPRPPHELEPSVPEHLEEVCLRLLQKDPAARFASASHLLHILGETADDEDLEDQWPPRTVGRTPFKARVQDALSEISEEGRGAALLITGPLGYGKTRLLELAQLWARHRGIATGGGRCRSHDRPFGAFAGVYRDLATETSPDVLSDVFGSADDERWERYQVISAFKELVVGRGPCVVLVDDIERAEPATLELLLYLIRNTLELAEEPILFLLGHETPEGAVRRKLEEIPSVQTLTLDALDAAEVEELVLSVVETGPASLALADRIHRESGGSPAFIADMLRGLLDDGTIIPSGTSFALTIGANEITRSKLPMPASLRQALKDRISPLSANALDTGRVIALARRRVDLDVLLEASSLGEEQLMEALDELIDAQIVEEERTQDHDLVELSHGRFRDVLLEPLTDEDRASRHRRMGEVLEREHRHRIGVVVQDLAYHFEEARLSAKAFAYLLQTSTRLLNRSLYEESLVFLGRALQMEVEARPSMRLDEADRSLAEVHLLRAQARFNLGQLDEAVQATRQAEELAEELRDERLRSRVAHELGVQLRNQGHNAEAETLLRQALQLGDDTGDQSLLPGPMYQLGGILWGRGDLKGAEHLWKQCLYIAGRIGDERARGHGYNGLAILALCRGMSMDARKHFEESAAAFERLGMLGPLVVSRVNLVELYLNTGRLKKAIALADRTVSQSREVHHQHGIALGLAWRAHALLTIGRTSDALVDATEALRMVRKLNAREDEVLALAVLIRVHFRQGDHELAKQRVEVLIPMMEEHDQEGIAPQVVAWHARAVAGAGDLDLANQLLDSIKKPQGQWPHVSTRANLSHGRALRIVGRYNDARPILQEALATAEANGYRYFQLLAHHELSRCHGASDAAALHNRVARATSRSLAANLGRDDAKRFLSRGWGTP